MQTAIDGHHAAHDSGTRTAPRPAPEDHRGPGLTRTAVRATLHCLTGCAIGEIAGLAIGTTLGWGNQATILLAVALAFLFGYGLTVASLRRGGLGLRSIVAVALAADTVSIVVMELMDNATMVLIPGAMDAGLTDGLFWGSLAAAFTVAFAVTVPINRALIARGMGHARAHHPH